MSFSAHADAKGIMQLISQCEPRNVMLVHGEAAKMDFLKNKIQQEFGIEFFQHYMYVRLISFHTAYKSDRKGLKTQHLLYSTFDIFFILMNFILFY